MADVSDLEVARGQYDRERTSPIPDHTMIRRRWEQVLSAHRAAIVAELRAEAGERPLLSHRLGLELAADFVEGR